MTETRIHPGRTFERGNIVTVDHGCREYLVRAVHSAGRDVLLTNDDRTGAGTWVAIEQVTFKRSGRLVTER